MGIRGWSLAGGLLFTRIAMAQTSAPELEKMLKGRPFDLRSYSADAKASYSWTGQRLVVGSAHAQALAEFTARSVKLKKNHLLIEGARTTLVYDKKSGTLAPFCPTEMKLDIDLGGSDPVAVLPSLTQQLFFLNRADAMAGLPDWIKNWFDEVRPKSESGHLLIEGDVRVWLDPKSPKIVPPQVVRIAEPEFTEEARRSKVSGTVTVFFQVSPTGHPEQFWLIKPLGLGLDQKALDVVRKYEFKPARLEGKPVRVAMAVEVDFQIF